MFNTVNPQYQNHSKSWLNTNNKNRPNNINFNNSNKNNNKPELSQTQQHTRTSIFYINDFHGNAINMERAITASGIFDAENDKEPTDKLKFSSGDIMLGADKNTNIVASYFLKILGIHASAVGNHECDMTSENFLKVASNLSCKLLACNIKNKPDNEIGKRIKKSYIQEINGTKYGVIGTLPTDLITRIKYGKAFQDQEVIPDNIDNTIKDVQKEIDNLEAQGINKIILLSHCGYGYDRKIAKNTKGLDIILGGHSHNLIEGVTKGENLLTSKSGEPVIITQAGRDGKNFGVLNVEFDSNGVITKAQNNISTTRGFRRNSVAKYVFEKILGKPETLGYIRTAPAPLKNDLIEPNPLAYFGLDSMREMTGSDIALVLASNLRGYVEKGQIDTSTTDEISPFKNKIVKINYTEKEIVDAIKFCAKSLKNRDNKPGIIYTSGLKYTVDKNGTVKDMHFINANGTLERIDVNNPRTDKIYSTAINEYYSSGNDNLTMLDKYFEATERYNWDINFAVENKIRKSKEPIDIVDDGRIKIVD